MKRLLFVITSDPRESHRPAEAIRIAAGVGVWKRVDITIYLREAAVLALSESPADLVEEQSFTRYLPMVIGFSRPIQVQRGAPLLGQLGTTPFAFEEIDDDQLARLAASSDCLLRF